MCYFFLAEETEGQRKRKGEEEEEKPAKRKVPGTGDVPEPSEPADATATALQNLALEKTPEEQQQEGPETGTALQAAAGQSSSDNISLDHRQEEVASDQPEGTVRLCLYCISTNVACF